MRMLKKVTNVYYIYDTCLMSFVYRIIW